MYTGKFSYPTLLLYIIISVIGAFCIKMGIKCKNDDVNNTCKHRERRYYIIFLIIYTCFATFRKIDYQIGGMDALNYVNIFQNATSMANINKGVFSEWIFYSFTYFIRSLTDNSIIYIAICYFIIATSYIVFINKYCKKKDVSCIPFILLTFLYLKSFNSMRTSLAIAIFLIALTMIEEHKICAILLCISTVFIHRVSIVFVLIVPFYYLYRYKLGKMNKSKLIVYAIVYILLSIIGARVIQKAIVYVSVFSATDLWYATSGISTSLLSRWPMFIAQLLLLICLVIYNNKIENSEENLRLKVFCWFDFIMLPATIILGIWRANEYLYVARLIMWGNIIPIIEKQFVQKKLVKSIIGILFMTWLVFRIFSEWDDLKIMPYIFRFAG